MRFTFVCLGAVVALAACGPAHGARDRDRDPSQEVRSPREIRIYVNSRPRCAYREVGEVMGRSYGELRTAAFRLSANAVIVKQERYQRVGVEGTAVRFTSAGCRF